MNQNDNIDVTEANFIGAIDRFATNIALAGLAALSSLVIIVVMPWRLTPMIKDGRPDGRDGGLLAPGVFFPLIFTASILLLGATIPELATVPDAPADAGQTIGIGSNDVSQMATAWRTGELNQILLIMFPVFVVCVLSFAATSWVRVLVGDWWTIRIAIRAGFYIFGMMLGVGCILAIVVSNLNVDDEASAMISMISTLAFLPVLGWCYLGIFKGGGTEGILRLAGSAALATATMILAFMLIAIIA